MDSAAKESILPDRLSERLGGLILKEEQKLAVEALMSGKDVLAVLPTGFGKSVIYQSFVLAKHSSFIVVIVPLRSIIDDQLQSNDFGLKAVAFDKKPELMKDIAANKFQVIFASAEQALSKEFRDLLKDESSEFRKTKWTRARVKHLKPEDHSLLPPINNISVEPRIELAQKREAIRSHSHYCWENQHQETKNTIFETTIFLEENVSHSSIEIQM